MRRRTVWLVGGVAILAAGWVATLPRFDGVRRTTPVASQQSRPVAEESPFLWFGKAVMDSGADPILVERFGAIIARFPNAAACITGTARPGDDIMDADLRWFELSSAEEVEVCLFRVFARLGSLARIEEWLTRQGWERAFLHDYSEVARFYGLPNGTKITTFSMHWDSRTKGAPFSKGWQKFRMERLNTGASIAVDYAERAGVLLVRVSGRSIWAK